MKYARRISLLSFCLFLGAPFAWAFSGSEGASFLDVPVGAGPAALGGAYTALANDAYAPVWNPAGLGFLDHTQLGAMHQAYIEDTAFEFLSIVQPLRPGHAIGASAQYFRPGDTPRTDVNGNVLGDFGGHYGAYTIAYGQQVTERLSLGIAGKLIEAAIDDVSAKAYAGDAGLFFRATPRLTLAATVVNLGSKLKFINEGDPLPRVYRMGGSYQATNDLRLSGQGSFPQSGRAAFNGGIEWPSADARGFCLRTGYSTDRTKELSALAGFVFGIGVPLWEQEVSYAWMPLSDFGHAHYFSLVFHFGREKEADRKVLAPNEAELLNKSGNDYRMLNEMTEEKPSPSLEEPGAR